jgi:hypothetical protein
LKSHRHQLQLRPFHPHEALLIVDLGGRPTGRRAARIRELLHMGLNRQPPPVTWTTKPADSETTVLPLRVALLIHERDPSDAPLWQSLAEVHPDLVSEYLRERLAAGLLGRDTCETELPSPGPVATFASSKIASPPKAASPIEEPIDAVAPSAARAVSSALDIDLSAAEFVPPGAEVMLGDDRVARPKRTELLALFE